MSASRSFIKATRELSDALSRLIFPRPVGHVYNPLDYARTPHETYLRRYLLGNQDVLFLGMNPGPFGMAQTGVPFGEVNAARNWLGIDGSVRSPEQSHPRKPVQGFDCPRSEVSGRRLWGLFAERFGTPPAFFANHFVYNYCPLLFLEEGSSGRNLTPENLAGEVYREMTRLCDLHLLRLLECCNASTLVGIGNFAAQRLHPVAEAHGLTAGKILHPSPASPAANRDWSGTATRQLQQLGVW